MEKKKKMPLWAIIALAVLGILIIGSLFAPDSTKAPEAVDTRKLQEDSLTKCYIVARRVLKESLKDPDSYQEVEEKKFFATDGTPQSYIQVSIKYRAKNSFGALTLENRCFNFDKSMTLTKAFKCE